MKRILLGLLAVTLSCNAARDLPAVRDGDIIFHTSRSSQSLAIQKATRSQYSHMGLVFHRHRRPYVFEAIGTVQYTSLDRWVARGAGRHFVVKRLKEANRLLTSPAIQKLRDATRQFQGRPYDLTFEWTDSRMYCSELVWKVYDRAIGLQIGNLQRVRDLDLTDSVVRSKMRERYGNHIPLDEPVITPGAMFRSSLLETVVDR